MNEIEQRINNLSPEKRRLLEQLLGEESNSAWSRAPYEAPRNEIERQLAEIWSSVLGIGTVGINDNYFELGGDSIQCIQIMSNARRVGIRITTSLLFENPTVAQLAAVAETGESAKIEDHPSTGPAPLTPVQNWFFNLNVPNINHWNQAMLLETAPSLDAEIIGKALQQVVDKHDALRLRFLKTEAGWEQEIAPAGETISLQVTKITESNSGDLSEVIHEVAERTQRSLDISRGPAIGAAFFDCGSQPGRLLIICHHLVADAVSFRIIAEDLEILLRLQSDPEVSISMMENTTSWRRWCHSQVEHAKSEVTQSERAYWVAHTQEPKELPVDYGNGSNLEVDAQTYTVTLSEEETTALFQKSIATLRADATEILLTALAQTLGSWTRHNELIVDLEGHGREYFDDTIDLSRTVGWFTTIYPVCISGRLDDWRAALRTVKETLRQMPRHGFGYGLLRYLLKDQALMKPRPMIAMNYLGRFDHVLPTDSLLRVASENYGQLYDTDAERPYILQVVSLVLDGRMQTNWIYSERLHSRATIESLAGQYLQTLRTMISTADASESSILTPADFPDAELSPLELERILKG
jgi:non-ribosomal peptide synthase protein (TIGR01720 family)